MSNEKVQQLAALVKEFDIIDLSRSYEEGMPVWITHPRYFASVWENQSWGDSAFSKKIEMGEHNGTHMDSPGHMIPAGDKHYFIDKLDPKKFNGRLLTIDLPHFLGKEVHICDAAIIKDWESKHVPIEAGDLVFIRYGQDDKYGICPNHRDFVANWGGLSKDGAEYLVSKNISVAGTDTLSIDALDNADFDAHKTLLGNDVYVIEVLVNLDKVPAVCFVEALPVKYKDGSGSPVRVLAYVPR